MTLSQMTVPFERLRGVKPQIVAKLDWLTLVYEGACVEDILSILCQEIDFSELDQAFSNRVEHSYGYLTDLFINYNGIQIAFHLSEVMDLFDYLSMNSDSFDSFSFFKTRFAYIRVDISGSGLDFLRSLGIDVDSSFRSMEFLSGGEWNLAFHVTRVDTSFDLINYGSDFLDRQIQICREYGNKETLRIGVAGKRSGLAYSIREGDQKTLYLGTGRSPHLLRIYDKLLQFRKSGKLGSCPYNEEDSDGNVIIPDSWIRIELQCRPRKGNDFILFGTESYLDVFMWIKNNFSLRSEGGRCDPSWIELFDWDECHAIIQNANSVQYVDVLDRSESWVKGIAFSNICTLVAFKGWKYFIDLINKQFVKLQLSQNPIDQKRSTALLCKIFSSTSNPIFLKNEMGIVYLDPSFMDKED